MKKKFSARWVSSKQPRKQRKFIHNAPLHVRRRFLSANIAPTLRERFGRRSIPVRKGDEVKIMRGDMRGKTGVVEKVDMSSGRVYLEGIKNTKVDGSSVPRPLVPSNLMIIRMKAEDKMRQAVFERAGQRKGKG